MNAWRFHRLKRALRLWVVRNKRSLLTGGGVVFGCLMLLQVFYPGGRLLPFQTVDDISFGIWQKQDVAQELDRRYAVQPVEVRFGQQTASRFSPRPTDIGLTARNEERIDQLAYPWYIKLIPGSILWYGAVNRASEPAYLRDEQKLNRYIEDELGSSCKVEPKNASLKVERNAAQAVDATPGGSCELDDVARTLRALEPRLGSSTVARVEVEEIPAKISTADAAAFAETINQRLKNGVAIKAGSATLEANAATVAGWMEFTNDDQLKLIINPKKAERYFNSQLAPKVKVEAGVTKVSTRDFVEVSRSSGRSGVTLNTNATALSVAEYLSYKADVAEVKTSKVAPRVEYSRSYSSSDTGLNALISQYAEDNDGVYGVQMIELSGERRRAGFSESRQFITASTYKLFVAYSTLKRVEDGKWRWSDQVVGGQNLSTCFEKMIANSDNPCAEAMYKKIGYQTVINEARALGLRNTVLSGDGQKTSAGDLATFLGALQSGSIDLNDQSRTRLLEAMRRNVYRNGIPAGAGTAVADKVGFLNGLLHDAAVVYSPKGTYVLVIMTDKSSW